MNLAEVFRGLARRWYIVLPGIILALVMGIATWSIAKPAYERTAIQVLLPGTGTLPEGASNPYLYLGGLPAAADVIVRALGSEESLRGILEEYPGSEVEVARDPSTSGPVINITVTASSDADAGAILSTLVDRTSTTLTELQSAQSVKPEDLITVSPISVDQVSTLQQRDRIVLSAGVTAGVGLLALIAASAVDGLVTRSRRDGRGGGRGGANDDAEGAGDGDPRSPEIEPDGEPIGGDPRVDRGPLAGVNAPAATESARLSRGGSTAAPATEAVAEDAPERASEPAAEPEAVPAADAGDEPDVAQVAEPEPDVAQVADSEPEPEQPVVEVLPETRPAPVPARTAPDEEPARGSGRRPSVKRPGRAGVPVGARRR